MATDAFCGEICSRGLDEIINAIRYICEYDSLVKSLETDLESLEQRLSSVKADVEYYKVKQRREIRAEVTGWMERVSPEIDGSKMFLGQTEKKATGCCGHDCNFYLRYQHAKEAEEKAEEIRKFTATGATFNEVYFRHLDPMPMASFWASGYVALPSMDQTIEELKRFLQADEKVGENDEKKLVMGIYGVKGVGKTILAKKLAADMESGGVKVVVTNGKDDTKKIQRQIAERIGFEFTVKAVTERARNLYETLCEMKVLIIFDNVDKKIDLNDIGVPQPAPDNGCRILVVSTTLRACEDMHSQMNLEIQLLTQIESEILAAGLGRKYNWSDYSLADISPEKAGMPGEIERLILNRTHRTTKQIESALCGGGISTAPSSGGEISAIPSSGGGISTSLSSGGEISAIPSSGGEISAIPSSGGGISTSLSSGFEISKSSSSGGRISTLLLDADALQIEHVKKSQYWRLDRSKSSSETVLIEVWYLHIEGKAMGLFPGIHYAAYFVYRLSEDAKGFKINPVVLIVGSTPKRCYLDPSKQSKYDKPKVRPDEWLEIEMGRFYSDDYAYFPVDLIVKDHDTSIAKSGLRIRGIELRQLLEVAS